ncbi:MAG: mechanosensitive ion channel family protein [Opitutales bacterium]
MEDFWDQNGSAILAWLTDIGAAIIILVIGLWVAKKIAGIFRKLLEKRGIEPVLVGFLGNLVCGLLIILVVIAALGQVGVETASFAAVIAAMGLAIGLALQGSLSNFAAGTLLILFKPFKTGDFIDGGGATGIVMEIGLLMTILKTPDNKKILVPNSNLMGDNLTNFTAHDTRRMDLTVGVDYSSDIHKVKELLMEVLTSHEKVLKDPAPVVALANFGDSSLDFWVRPWVPTAEYWDIYFELHTAIKDKLDEADVSIPFPQHDVHIIRDEASPA